MKTKAKIIKNKITNILVRFLIQLLIVFLPTSLKIKNGMLIKITNK